MPALPLDEAGKYVAGAYVVFVALVLVYVAIIGSKIARVARGLEELNELADARRGGGDGTEPASGESPVEEPELLEERPA
jgi:hypothetical protein